jgi:hypothetical protein
MLQIFDNRVFRNIFGPKRREVTGDWRKMHDYDLRDLYASPNIILLIGQRKVRYLRHVTRMEEKRMHAAFWWGNLKEKQTG